MKKTKKILAALLSMTLVIASFTGCGSSGSASSDSSASSSSGDSSSSNVSDALKNYRENGFRIGADFLNPYIYKNDNGKIEGVDYDILTTILKELGINDIEVKQTPYESVILELNNNNVDCTCDGMYITEERMKQGVWFSDAYCYENDVMLVRSDSGYKTMDDLKGKTLAVCTGSVAESLGNDMKDNGEVGEVTYYTSNDLTFQALSSGQADAVLCDCFAAVPGVSNDSLGITYMDSYEPRLDNAVAGYGFRSADKAFVEEFNKVLNEMKEDGRLQKIFDKWHMNSSVFIGVDEGKTKNIAE